MTERQHTLNNAGYVLVQDVFDPERDFGPVFDDWNLILDDIAAGLADDGLIDSTYTGLPFPERLVEICADSGRTFAEQFDITLPQHAIAADTPLNLPDSIFQLLTSPRLLDIVEELIGPEIAANPVQHIRMKLPRRALPPAMDFEQNGLLGRVGWHQDNGVVLPEADDSLVLSVWFPLGEANLDNGCLRVIPGSHTGEIVAHCPDDSTGLSIPESLISASDAIPVPMEAGSALFFHRRLVHESLANTTENEIRISADLRFQTIGAPTGRPIYPGLPLRSVADPASTVGVEEWRRAWEETKSTLVGAAAPRFNRWDGRSPACA
jgi:phytanoyl-CoA hydroxylase